MKNTTQKQKKSVIIVNFWCLKVQPLWQFEQLLWLSLDMYSPYILTWNMNGSCAKVIYDPLLNCLQKFGFYMEYYVKVGIVTFCWLDSLVFEPPQRQVPKATHPLVEWVLGLIPGVKEWGHVIDWPSPSSTKVVYGQSCRIIPLHFFLRSDSELTILPSHALPNQLQSKHLPQ